MKKERGILFQTEMSEAILLGHKTQTRRTRGLDEINKASSTWRYDGLSEERPEMHGFEKLHNGKETEKYTELKCPFGQVGDLLYVRETFGYEGETLVFKAKKGYLSGEKPASGWKSSLFMPKVIARTWLEIGSVHAERAQAISKEDAEAEGVETCIATKQDFGCRAMGMKLYRNYERADNSLKHHPHNGFYHAKTSFVSLWKSINGEESWDANPWVWVIKFRKLSYYERTAPHA